LDVGCEALTCAPTRGRATRNGSSLRWVEVAWGRWTWPRARSGPPRSPTTASVERTSTRVRSSVSMAVVALAVAAAGPGLGRASAAGRFAHCGSQQQQGAGLALQ
jgi:hypothetical protein